MGDHHCGQAEPLVQLAVRPAQAVAGDRVQGAEGFVHQHDARAGGQGAGHAHPLPLAAGQGRRRAPGIGTGQADEIQQLQRPRLDVGPAPAQQRRRDADVLGHGQVWEQSNALEHIADAAAQLRGGKIAGGGAFDHHPAAVGLGEAVDHLQRGGLARARRADQSQEGALGHAQADAIDGFAAAAVEGLADVLKLDDPPGHGAQLVVR